MINSMLIKAYLTIKDKLSSERGDTNFISIIIILGIVLLVAGIFIGFKDDIVDMVEKIVESFTLETPTK